ncbi:helix-turn-helix domain-containing protein [Streptomyces glaucus]|uniref:helix-turn-helix domain-containing protein n=1 Tax=Streptomyces glaucus TaxID=284029 RepID=UPI003CD08F52
MSDGTAAADFAAMLKGLKDRSRLSYGVLAKRLHMSTSTLHRYCNGDAVPTDYAPVERLARLCRATPEELVELHRRWVLADALRGRKGGATAGSPAEAGASAAPVAPETPVTPVAPAARVAPAETAPQAPEVPAQAPEILAETAPRTPETVPDAPETPEAGAETAPVPAYAASEAVVTSAAPEPRRRARAAVTAGAAVAAVLGAVVFAVNQPSGGTDGDGRRSHAGAVAPADDGTRGTASPSTTRSSSSSPSSSPSASPSRKEEDKPKAAGPSATASPTGGRRGGSGGSGAGASSAAPLTVNTFPYDWENPCAQRYLVDRPPGEVEGPPLEQDAPAWVARYGAVSSGEQYVKLTVQGTGEETVVVEDLTVRMAGKRAPLAWNDYAMGYPDVGCGGDVPKRSFTVALDAVRPAVVPDAGHQDFPFTVSRSDPEVYYIRADASAYDVSWYLELTWSSGSRRGTVTVNDDGRPFRTSGNNGRPAYEFSLSSDEWVEAGT